MTATSPRCCAGAGARSFGRAAARLLTATTLIHAATCRCGQVPRSRRCGTRGGSRSPTTGSSASRSVRRLMPSLRSVILANATGPACAGDRCGRTTRGDRCGRGSRRSPGLLDDVVGRAHRDGGQRRVALSVLGRWPDSRAGCSRLAGPPGRSELCRCRNQRIELATGVLLLPEHNPLLLAKQAASLDALTGGRMTLGVGIGWSREEFAALGIPFERRGERAAEYVAAMRVLWREDIASFGRRVRGVRFRTGQSEADPQSADPDRGGWQQRRRATPSGRLGRRLVRVQPSRRRCGPRADRRAARALPRDTAAMPERYT